MKHFEVRIPRAVRMTEWEIMVVEAEDKEQALDYALARENMVSKPEYQQEDWESIDEYLDDVDIAEIDYQQEEGV